MEVNQNHQSEIVVKITIIMKVVKVVTGHRRRLHRRRHSKMPWMKPEKFNGHGSFETFITQSFKVLWMVIRR